MNALYKTAVSLLAICAAVPQGPAAVARVPASVLRLVGGSPLTLAMALADASVPAGLEIKQTDWAAPHPHFDLTRDDAFISEIELVAAFNERHSAYRAVIIDGVIVIRPIASQPDYLDSEAKEFQVQGRGLVSIASRLFEPLKNGGSRLGQTGSMLSAVGVDVDRGDNIALTVDSRGQAVLTVLNGIVMQAPGHVWLVVVAADSRTPLRFGFVHQSGTTTERAIPESVPQP